ncbi:MAG: CoA transferase, partial [Betaproteobacteria bacterium HGW-Betaproteobacteria-18]
VPQRQGNTHPSLAPYQTFDTLDGTMLLAIGNDGQFARFCEAAGHSEWAADARFTSNTLRVKNRESLIPTLQAVTCTRSTAQWIALLEDKAVPCGPINDIGQAFADAQVQARGLVVRQPVAPRPDSRPALQAIATVASPLRLTATPPVLHRPPPALGEHTDEVLTELGLDAAQVAGLRQRGVV